jgi:hypothetical protein
VQPRVGVAAVVDGLPLAGLLVPRHERVLGQRVRVRVEVRPPRRRPPGPGSIPLSVPAPTLNNVSEPYTVV